MPPSRPSTGSSTTTTCCSPWSGCARSPDLAEAFRARHRYIMVDEYQRHHRVPGQAGATFGPGDGQRHGRGRRCPVHLRLPGSHGGQHPGFSRSFPGTTIIKLEENYRSTQPILTLTNAILQHAGRKYEKNLFTQPHGRGQTRTGTPFFRPDPGGHGGGPGARAGRPLSPARDRRAVSGRLPVLRPGSGTRQRPASPTRSTAGSNSPRPPTSRTCWPTCVSPATRPISRPGPGCWPSCRVSGPRRPPKSSRPSSPATGPCWPRRRPDPRHSSPCSTFWTRCAPCRRCRPTCWPGSSRPTPRCWPRNIPEDYPRRQAGLEQLQQIAVTYHDMDTFLADLVIENPEADRRQAKEGQLVLSTVHSAKGLDMVGRAADRPGGRTVPLAPRPGQARGSGRGTAAALRGLHPGPGIIWGFSRRRPSTSARPAVARRPCRAFFCASCPPACWPNAGIAWAAGPRVPSPPPARRRPPAEATAASRRPHPPSLRSKPNPRPWAIVVTNLRPGQDHRQPGRGKVRVNFPNFGPKVILADYLELEDAS